MTNIEDVGTEVPEVEVSEQDIDNFEVPLTADPVNHVQTEENYELPSVNPESITSFEEPQESVAYKPEMDMELIASALRALAVNRPKHTTGFEVDAAVERFLSSDDKHAGDVAALKYRLGCLAAEADAEVGQAITEILKVVG